MASPTDVLLDDSGRIRWRRLGSVSVGAVVGAVFSGLTSVVLAVFDVPLSLYGGLAEFAGEAVGLVARTPAVIIERGWVAAGATILDAGPAGFVVAVAVVLATLYSVSWVMSRVG